MSSEFPRGSVFTTRMNPVEGSKQGGVRPAVVVSNDHFNLVMPIVTVVPMTSFKGSWEDFVSEVLLARGDGGLKHDSIALCHQVRTIAKSRLGKKIGSLSDPAMALIDSALLLHLSL